MSTILDALNKLEEEKELAREQEDLKPEDVDARAAAEEMIGRDVLRDTFMVRVNPLMLIGGGLVFSVVLVVAVAVSVALVLKPDAPVVERVASVPPLPVQETLSTPAVESTPEAPAVEAGPEPVLEKAAPVVELIGESSIVTPEAAKAIEVVERPQVERPAVAVSGAGEPIKIAEARRLRALIEGATAPVPVAEETVVTPKIAPAPKPAPVEIDVLTLPPFTADMRNRYGLNNLLINIVNPKSERNPYGSAMINNKKVFEDGYIAASQIRLHKVVNEGIAVEVSRTGDKYFIEY